MTSFLFWFTWQEDKIHYFTTKWYQGINRWFYKSCCIKQWNHMWIITHSCWQWTASSVCHVHFSPVRNNIQLEFCDACSSYNSIFCCYQIIISYLSPSPSSFIFFFSLSNYYLPITITILGFSKCHWFLPLDSSCLKLITTRLPLLHATLKDLPSSFHQADTGTCV